MRHSFVLWKAILIVFTSSFCLMVIELIAGRILAPYIGVSLYTWTSIIGVIMAGIALGNFAGGKIADRYPSPNLLMASFFLGSLATVAILPAIWLVTTYDWFGNLPVIWNFTFKTAAIFFLPAFLLSLVSPAVIKLTLADLGKTGGTIGTIYAWSTAGSILGTFMTGFYFILWFGVRSIIWIVAGTLIAAGITSWIIWKSPSKPKVTVQNAIILITTIAVVAGYLSLWSFRDAWQVNYTRESNYYSIRVLSRDDDIKILSLDHLIHSFVKPAEPTYLDYPYLKVFSEIVGYIARDNPAPALLHLGGGGYSFPRYMEAVYRGSVNDVVEIDPAVTEIAQEELGLAPNTTIRSYNEDARLFMMEKKPESKYDFVIGDVFNDKSTPYHLTTLEFDRMVKTSLRGDGIYLVNVIDRYEQGEYMPAFVNTLKKVFKHVYLFSPGIAFDRIEAATFIIAATDREIDLTDYADVITNGGTTEAKSVPLSEAALDKYLSERKPILLTDDYAPTDNLVAELFE